jgi:hypothetical protein
MLQEPQLIPNIPNKQFVIDSVTFFFVGHRAVGVLHLDGDTRQHTAVAQVMFPSPGTKAMLEVRRTCEILLIHQHSTCWKTTLEEDNCCKSADEESRTIWVSSSALRDVFSIPARAGIPSGAHGIFTSNDGTVVAVARVLDDEEARCDSEKAGEIGDEGEKCGQDLIPLRLTVRVLVPRTPHKDRMRRPHASKKNYDDTQLFSKHGTPSFTSFIVKQGDARCKKNQEAHCMQGTGNKKIIFCGFQTNV